jgi:hypothetical protein
LIAARDWGSIPSFRTTLTAAQIRDVAAFVAARAGTGG